jgi:inorganic triphosphatase YgiF
MRPEASVVGTVGEAADSPNREIELKLRIDPPAAAKLRRSSVVAARKIGRARTRNLVSTYFDTGDRGLERNGLTLRVRRVGARRVQTLKGMTSGLAGRPEWETDVEGDTPDLSRFDGASGVPEGLDGPDVLQPIFTTAVRRTAWLLRADDGSAVELALDQGELRADGLLRRSARPSWN